LSCGFLLLVLAAVHEPLFRSVGYSLVETQAPTQADVIVVLAGGWRGERILKAAELVKAGYAPKVLVSGPMSLYGVNEADLAISLAARNGYDRSSFEPVYAPALSTMDEAHQFAPRLRQLGVRRILLVTSSSHTRRAAATFRRELGNDVEVCVVAAKEKFFAPENWWHHREGQKTVFYEVSKTVAGWVGL
jgi:uncharacterized SAM-binding protein YcdF (DUF218 family)